MTINKDKHRIPGISMLTLNAVIYAKMCSFPPTFPWLHIKQIGEKVKDQCAL